MLEGFSLLGPSMVTWLKERLWIKSFLLGKCIELMLHIELPSYLGRQVEAAF